MPSRPLSSNPSPSPDSILRAKGFLLAITISAVVLLLLGLFFLLYYLWYSLVNRSRTSPVDISSPLKLQRFSFEDLNSATNKFTGSYVIGKGGSGTVFRGILRDGKSVAIKKLDSISLQAETEFQNELQVLGGLQSPYVVTLLGSCVEKKKRCLVYEYMPNRSLQELLFAEGPGAFVLDWNQRFEIIVDIACALAYLHLECVPPVIHSDIKPSNVLLNSDFRAKLSDFGLSRIKSDGEFGVGFSQELGLSQELLWKTHDFSGNLVKLPPETPTESNTEEDVPLGRQASSSSSKNNRIGFNARSYPSTPNAKGKEVFPMAGEAFDDDLINQGRDLNFNAYLSINDTATGRRKQWGKDWWWRRDGSGELRSKDYVREWIGTQIYPSTNSDWDEEKKSSPYLNRSMTLKDQFENVNGNQFHEQGHGHPKKKGDKKHIKMHEWWKEENLAAISKKGNKSRKLELSFRRAFKIALGPKFGLRRAHTLGEQMQNDSDANVDLSFKKGRKKKKANSNGSEIWSGDQLSTTTSVRGTVCYVAPEYGNAGYLMEKADIYSLGVLILVIISGRRPLHVLSSPIKLNKANLISWCRQLAKSGNVLELVDERLGQKYNKDQTNLCINLALLCIQKTPELRPDAGEIVKILRGEMDIPPFLTEFSPSSNKLLSRSIKKVMAEEE